IHTHTTTPRASRSRTILSGLVLTFAWAVSAAAAPSHHGHPGKLSDTVRDEAKAKGSAKVDVLVRFTGNPGASERSLVKALGGHVRRQHRSRWVAVRIPGNALEAL